LAYTKMLWVFFWLVSSEGEYTKTFFYVEWFEIFFVLLILVELLNCFF